MSGKFFLRFYLERFSQVSILQTGNKKNGSIMVGKTAKDYKKDYTDPVLRAELKEEIKEDNKGGKAGQWSARKSQILSKEYEAQGGGYKHPGKLTDSQKDLKKWQAEESAKGSKR